MILELTTWQRVKLFTVIGGLRGTAAFYRNCCKLLDLLEMSEEEREEIGLVQEGPKVIWADEGRRWPLEVKDRELLAFFKRQVEAYQEWSPRDREQIDDLFTQLGI